ncbi:SurA [Microbacterium sp. CBS5P-1]|nr:SurA [Microbacterium excoecariae]
MFTRSGAPMTRRARALFAAAAVATLALAGCAATDDDAAEPTASASAEAATPEADLEGVPDVVAVVNGDEIGIDEFRTAYETRLQSAALSASSTGEEVDQEALKTETADLLVNNRLLTQAASDAGIEATDADVDDVLQGVADQAGLEDVAAVIDAFAEQGVDEDQVRQDAAAQFQIDGLIAQEAEIEEPTEAELQAQYDALVEQAEAAESGSEIPAFEDVRDQLEEQTITQQQNAATQQLIDDLRADAEITVNL